MVFRTFVVAGLAALLAAPSLAQTPQPLADPGAPLSGYPRKALGLPTAAELKTATYVRDVIYGHRDGMALTYDVFKPLKPNGALVVNMVSAGWRSQWGPPEERQARYQWLIDKGFTALHEVTEYWDSPSLKIFRGSVKMTFDDPKLPTVRPVMTHFFYMDQADPTKVKHWYGSVGPTGF